MIAANASTAIQNFYNNNATTKYNKYNEIVDNLNALGSVNSLINGEALNYMASLLTELINARSLFSTLNLNSTSIEIHNAILLYTNNLNNGIFSNKPDAQIAASLMFQKQTAIDDIIDVINSITENDVFASNRKDALRIVIKIFENEEIVLNQNEIDFVNSLAFDCPYIKGDGVFIAQAIYNLINSSPANFDNTAQCAVFGVTYKSTLNANGLDENVQQDLNVFQNFENVKSIEVYDLAGKLVAISNSKNSNFIKQHLKENNFYIIKHTSITNVVTYSRLFYIER
ncbi:MAG: hypothetical protein IPO27_00680 [Bacteroidetes bacterium]|nr:hypothetical protein [Bacteroidota bacterium]